MKKIEVKTYPNGYSLDMDNESFFYFTPLELMEGVMYHVGLEEEKACSKATISDMLTASMTYKAEGSSIAEIGKCQAEVNMLRNKLSASDKKCVLLSEKVDDIMDELKRIADSRSITGIACQSAVRNIIANYSVKRKGMS